MTDYYLLYFRYSDISNNRQNCNLTELASGSLKVLKHQNHEIGFYDFLILIALIKATIGLN